MYSSLKSIQNLMERIDDSFRDYRLLTEDQESKSIAKAKKLLKQTFPSWDDARIDDFVRKELRETFSCLHHNRDAGKFIYGLTRMLCNNELKDGGQIAQLNATIRLIAAGHLNEYDQNLNGMSPDELIERFAGARQEMGDQDREETSSLDLQENNDYTIVRIDNFEQSSKYAQYTDWCVTHNEGMLNSYTSGGIGQFYFCLKNGFEKVPREKGEGCPLDEYGLSMVAVVVDENGDLTWCTCRWNHDNGGNDNIMDTKQISQLIGRNFYDVFKPNNNLKEKIDFLLQKINNGEPFERIFEDIREETSEFAVVSAVLGLNEYDWGFEADWNVYNKRTKNFISSKWFEDIRYVTGTDKFIVSINYKSNIITLDGKYLFEKWLMNIDFLEYNGHIYYIINFGKPANQYNTALTSSYNLLDENFNKVIDEDFKYLTFGSSSHNPTGKYVALIREESGGYNLIDINGNRLYDKDNQINLQRFNGDNAAKSAQCQIQVNGELTDRRCYGLVFSDGHDWKKWYKDIGFVSINGYYSTQAFAVRDFSDNVYFVDRYENPITHIGQKELSEENIVWRRVRRSGFRNSNIQLIDNSLLVNYHPT